MTDLTGVLILATITEAFVEYFAAPLVKRYANGNAVKYVAAAVGVALCVAYNVDILEMLAGLTPKHPMVGYALSGVIIGRGSNFLNDVVGMVRGANGG